MSYVDGAVLAVPTANKADYQRHAEAAGKLLKEFGALSVVDCWGDDVPPGKLTSFPMAVNCKSDETVVFSWIIWPSRAARDEGFRNAMADERFRAVSATMPFDGQRMIFAGFETIVNL